MDLFHNSDHNDAGKPFICETPVLNCTFFSRRIVVERKLKKWNKFSQILGLQDWDKLEAKGQAENTKRATSRNGATNKS